MAEGKFERHRQPWRTDEVQKLHTLAKKGMALKAIAKALTEAHGGHVSVASRGPGQGSTFTVAVPIHAPSEARDERYGASISS